MIYLFDTNILVYFIRKHKLAEEISKRFRPFDDDNISLVSVVTHAELLSLALQLGWGEKKKEVLNNLINQFLVVPIEAMDLVMKYAEIDAYSQGKLNNKESSESLTARNMGKNDLWIAATSHVTRAKLLTTDNDFDHLDGKYFELIKLNSD